jgi:ParB-like chromosome segregation protein Spo0J
LAEREVIQIQSKKIEFVPIGNIQPNKKNRNLHSEEQIDRLCQIIKYQGFRTPLIVSNRSGLLVAGHGRLLAAKKLGIETLPVLYQDFEDEDQEYAAQISDNAIASWAELDLAAINADIPNLGPFDIDLLGINGFTLGSPDFEPGTEDDQGQLDEKSPIECPKCHHLFVK